jgi:hypothetical protein
MTVNRKPGLLTAYKVICQFELTSLQWRTWPKARTLTKMDANFATRTIQTRRCAIADWLDFRSLVVLSPQIRGSCLGPAALSTTRSAATPIDAASNLMVTTDCVYAGTSGFRWLAELLLGPASVAIKPGALSDAKSPIQRRRL